MSAHGRDSLQVSVIGVGVDLLSRPHMLLCRTLASWQDSQPSVHM